MFNILDGTTGSRNRFGKQVSGRDRSRRRIAKKGRNNNLTMGKTEWDYGSHLHAC